MRIRLSWLSLELVFPEKGGLAFPVLDVKAGSCVAASEASADSESACPDSEEEGEGTD